MQCQDVIESAHQWNYIIFHLNQSKSRIFLSLCHTRIWEVGGRIRLPLLSSPLVSCRCLLLFCLLGSLPLFFLCCGSSDAATAENSSPAGPAAQAAQQPWRQPVLQPAKCEFKVPIKAFVWLWFHMIIQLNLPVPDPGAPPPRFSASCLEHVLMLFICCFHVRMSAFTVNNWCGLSKLSKMHASSDSLEPFDQKKLCCDFWYYQHLLAFNTKSLWIKN